MSTKLKLTADQLDLFRMFGTSINVDTKTYSYFPFWIMERQDDLAQEMISPENLPPEVIEFINSARGTTKKYTFRFVGDTKTTFIKADTLFEAIGYMGIEFTRIERLDNPEEDPAPEYYVYQENTFWLVVQL